MQAPIRTPARKRESRDDKFAVGYINHRRENNNVATLNNCTVSRGVRELLAKLSIRHRHRVERIRGMQQFRICPRAREPSRTPLSREFRRLVTRLAESCACSRTMPHEPDCAGRSRGEHDHHLSIQGVNGRRPVYLFIVGVQRRQWERERSAADLMFVKHCAQ